MKVIKDNDLSILFKPWGYGDKYYLHLTTIVGFSLLSPATLLREQELWGKLPQLLGGTGMLDESMPKVRGEFLVTGKCHAPAGETLRAGRVTAAVGPLAKHLHVFGDRHWQRNSAGLPVISDPEPFAAIDLIYENAFGGPDFTNNPVGKGGGRRGEGEKTLGPLPNVELPGREIGTPTDQPEPAGFAPLDRMWPQRFLKVGTYDEQWQKTRWPYFPADMDFEFFNMAPVDQRLDGFFTGDEQFLIEGMHPEHQRIQNTLPPVRPRQFVYRKINPEQGFEPDNLLFEEALLRLDTVWLFPEGLVGVLVFHGSVEIQDEEYLDVHRLYLTKEPTSQPPEDLTHYRDTMLAGMDLGVPMDLTPFQEAVPKFEGMLKKWRNIPKQIEEIKNRAMGKAPKMTYTPEETSAILKGGIAGSSTVLGNLEHLATNMHAQYGHLVKIDLAQFDAWRKRLEAMGQRADDLTATAREMGEQAVEVQKTAGQQLKAHFTPEQLKQGKIDPDNLLAPLASEPWQQQAFALVLRARKSLENNPEALHRLAALGFEPPTIERAWLGMVNEPLRMPGSDLGFGPGELKEDPFTLPPGLVLPFFEEAEPRRIAIRNASDWLAAADEFVLPGSRPAPVLLPSCLKDNPPVVVVAEQMTALFLEQEVGDACTILWLPDTKADLGKEVEDTLEHALRILVITPGVEPSSELAQWAAQRPKADCLVIPENQPSLFAARQYGVKIRPWVLKALPEDFAKAHDIEITLPAAGEAPNSFLAKGNLVPPMDIKGMVEKALAEINAFYQPQKDALGLEREKMLDQAAEALKKSRPELDAALAQTQQTPPASPTAIGRQVTDQLKAGREELQRQGQLTFEIDAKYQEAIGRVERDAAEAQANADRLHARLIASQKELEDKKAQLAAGRLPDDAAETMRASGLDPDRMRALTREEVVELHGRGESLSLYNLSGLDLSGLDLTGADLSRARCVATLFVNTRLAGGDLSHLMANKADFTGADLSGAKAEMALFPEAVMRRTVFKAVQFKQVSFKDVDLSEADFSGAALKLVSFDSCAADGLSFRDARLDLAVFNGVSGKAMDFAGMRGYKCLFQHCRLDGADCTQVALPSCMFLNCQGKNVVFVKADLSRTSICQGSVFPGGDFRQARMHESCIKDSDLSGADLRQASLDGSLFEGCDLTGACMRKTIAPRTRFHRVNMEGADLRGINLLFGSLRRSRLVNADLSASNLYGADLYKAVLGQTKLEGANLKLTLLANDRQQDRE